MINLDSIFKDHYKKCDNNTVSIEKLEQKNIKIEKSTEADGEEESFSDAGAKSDNENNTSNDNGNSETNDSEDNSNNDNSNSSDEDDWGNDSDNSATDTSNIEDSVDGSMDGTDDSGDDSNNDNSDDNTNEDNGNGGEQDVDKNVGSTLNPFTQVNQKLYILQQMNLLQSSIANAIDRYNTYAADSAELRQLKQLLTIVTEEQESFILQQNPENLIKYQLYEEQFSNIIKNLGKYIQLKTKDFRS